MSIPRAVARSPAAPTSGRLAVGDPNGDLAIRVENLTKVYNGQVKALDGISFEVKPGEAFGLLGPNGAGKTTTVSILTTLLRPTSGRAIVNGIDVTANPERVRRNIGLAFQVSTADGELTGRENLEVAAGLQGMPRAESRLRINELLDQMQLKSSADRLVKGYSGGMRRRLELAVGVIHSPRVLFLDEPTLGLDPQGRAGFWDYIRHLRKDTGVTLLLTTHYLEEADQLCERLAIVDHGKIVATGTPDSLKETTGGDSVIVKPTKGQDLTSLLTAIPGVMGVTAAEGAFRVKCTRGESMVPSIVTACAREGIELASVAIRKPSLDEVFLELTGREYRAEEGDAAGYLMERMTQMRQGGGRP
ncbi:MAG: ATP-binding cassette domain-containing protein [Thermoplasmata archaeon]